MDLSVAVWDEVLTDKDYEELFNIVMNILEEKRKKTEEEIKNI